MKLSAEEKAELDDLNHDSREIYYYYNFQNGKITEENVYGYMQVCNLNYLLKFSQWLTFSEMKKLNPQALEKWENSK